MRYINSESLQKIINSSQAIEQWIGAQIFDDYSIIKWIRLEKSREGKLNVFYFESFDDGNEDLLDVYSFESLDPDKSFGQMDIFNNLSDALEFSRIQYNAKIEKYVNEGVIQDEYKDYLLKK